MPLSTGHRKFRSPCGLHASTSLAAPLFARNTVCVCVCIIFNPLSLVCLHPQARFSIIHYSTIFRTLVRSYVTFTIITVTVNELFAFVLFFFFFLILQHVLVFFGYVIRLYVRHSNFLQWLFIGIIFTSVVIIVIIVITIIIITVMVFVYFIVTR